MGENPTQASEAVVAANRDTTDSEPLASSDVQYETKESYREKGLRWLEEESLEDPVAPGPCALRIEFRNRGELIPAQQPGGFESHGLSKDHVFLWRFDAPSNANWSEGDQVVNYIEVQDQSILLQDLAAGRYRATSISQVPSADDPPAFVVEGPMTQIVFDLDLPRSFPILLRVFDEHGQELLKADASQRWLDYDGIQVMGVPAWVRRRYPRVDDDVMWLQARGEYTVDDHRHGSVEELTSQTAGPSGFPLGEVTQWSQAWHCTYSYGLQFSERTEVWFKYSGNPRGSQHMVSVAIDPELVLDHLLLPNGEPASVLREDIKIRAGAIHNKEAAMETPWLEVPIQVLLAKHDTYEDIDFSFHLSDLPLPDHHLVLRASASSKAELPADN